MKTYYSITRLMVVVSVVLAFVSCGQASQKNRAVFLLLDTSGTYTEELNKARAITNYLLAKLESGDSIAIGRIDSGSFSEKDIIAKTTFDSRPSVANDQKRNFQRRVEQYVNHLKSGSSHTDITGGVIQASDFVKETGAEKKYVLIFSDLEEDLPTGHIRNFPLDVKDVKVVALNVTKLIGDNIDPRQYRGRLSEWQKKVEVGGGKWQVINDLERLDGLLID